VSHLSEVIIVTG